VALTQTHFDALTREGLLTCLTVLVVVRPLRLRRVIEELLRDRPGLRIVRSEEAPGLHRRAARLAPDVVVASVRALGREQAAFSAEIRRSSPRSKVILIHSVPVTRDASGADAHIEESAVVRRLVSSVERLTGRSRKAKLQSHPSRSDRIK
jgi:DNA-binding NarL/FixJ family response regulator